MELSTLKRMGKTSEGLRCWALFRHVNLWHGCYSWLDNILQLGWWGSTYTEKQNRHSRGKKRPGLEKGGLETSTQHHLEIHTYNNKKMQLQPFGRSDLGTSRSFRPFTPKNSAKVELQIPFQHSFQPGNQATKASQPNLFLRSVREGRRPPDRFFQHFLYILAAVPCRLDSGVRPVGTRKWSQRKLTAPLNH